MRVRKEQIEALAVQRRDAFAETVAAKLGDYFPERSDTLGQPKVLAAAKAAVEDAMSLGFSSERQVAMFAALRFLYGEDTVKAAAADCAREPSSNPWESTPEGRLRALVRALVGQTPPHGKKDE